ncbi:MAG: phosphoenolpyruvate carboxylase, partial [Alphaproteobacteria bacterium]
MQDGQSIERELSSVNYPNHQVTSEAGEIPLQIIAHLNNHSTENVASLFEDILHFSEYSYEEQENILTQKILDLSLEERADFAKARLVYNLVQTAIPVIKNMDDQKKPETNGFHLPSMIGLAKEAGYNAEAMESFLNTVRVWKSITPHPTEHLNKDGRDLYREMMAAADLPEQERAAHIQKVTQELLSIDIAPTRKATMMEETNDALEQAAIHREGLRKVYRDMRDALDYHYGEDGPNKPDLLSPRIRMDMGLRIWHAGDADGKPNADRWSLMSTMVLLAKESVQEHLDDIKKAINLELGYEEDEFITSEHLFDRVEVLDFPRVYRDRIRSDIKLLSTTLHTITTIESQCLQEESRPDYEQVKAQFSQLPIGSTQSREMCRDLNDLQRQFTDPRAREVLEESVFLLR